MAYGREGDSENDKWVWRNLGRVFDQRWGNEMQDWKVSYCCCYGGVVDVVCLSEGGRGA